jgi:hypothetical protein
MSKKPEPDLRPVQPYKKEQLKKAMSFAIYGGPRPPAGWLRVLCLPAAAACSLLAVLLLLLLQLLQLLLNKPIRARAHYVALSAATPSPINTWRTAVS